MTDQKIRIVKGIEDPESGVWLKVRSGKKSGWVARSSLVGESGEAFKRLEKKGIVALTRSAQNDIKQQAQDFTAFKSRARVADRPGWYGLHFVLPNGECVSPENAIKTKPVICFCPNPKCVSSGTKLTELHKVLAPLMKNQSLPLFMIAYALAPALMALLGKSPMNIGNTGVDIVGKQNSGKTILLSLAGSAWGTDPDVTVRRGYAESWSGTTEGTMKRLPLFQDGFLGLDDTGLSPGAPQKRAVAISEKVMRLSDGGEKDRYDGPPHARPSRLLYASTGNASIRAFLEGHPDVIDAHRTRLITIKIREVGGLGIFTSIPKGCKSAQEAANDLYLAQRKHFGLLGPAFIRKLVAARAKDEPALVRKIETYMSAFHKRISKRSKEQPVDRVWRPFALAYAAGRLAKVWGVIPPSWGNFKNATTRAYRLAVENIGEGSDDTRSSDPLDAIRDYAASNKLIDIRRVKTTMTKAQVAKAPGFIAMNRDGRAELQMSPKRFKQIFSESKAILKELTVRKLIAKERSKSSVKRSLRQGGPDDRVYAIYIRFPEDDPEVKGVEIAPQSLS